MKAQNKKILTVICMLLICLAGYSGYRTYAVFHGYRQARQAYREYSQEYVVYNEGSGSPEPVFEEEPAAPSETSPLSVDFHDLRKNLNPEICAWILCPDTVINYPVVQHSENGYYLNVNVNGEQNASGAIFLDSANFSDFRDTNNILHGHHMGDGSMFASLDRWQQEAYLAETRRPLTIESISLPGSRHPQIQTPTGMSSAALWIFKTGSPGFGKCLSSIRISNCLQRTAF